MAQWSTPCCPRQRHTAARKKKKKRHPWCPAVHHGRCLLRAAAAVVQESPRRPSAPDGGGATGLGEDREGGEGRVWGAGVAPPRPPSFFVNDAGSAVAPRQDTAPPGGASGTPTPRKAGGAGDGGGASPGRPRAPDRRRPHQRGHPAGEPAPRAQRGWWGLYTARGDGADAHASDASDGGPFLYRLGWGGGPPTRCR